MISFDDIDSRLLSIGKNRSWLAEAAGRKPSSIGDALAPNASPQKRSAMLQKALSDAIEAEERKQQTPASNVAPDTITLIPTEDQYERWSAAQKDSTSPTLKAWAIEELNRAADEWARKKGPQILPDSESESESDQAGNGG